MKRPNIIFILQDHQAFYGHGMYEGGVVPKRPNFEAFAARGIEFTEARCVTPMCGPTRRSLLTGLYPHNHGQVHNENDPPYKNDVLLRLLKDSGYDSYYFGKWHAGPGAAADFGAKGFSYTSYGNPYLTSEYHDYLKKNNLPPAEHSVEYSFMADSYVASGFFPGLKNGNSHYRCETSWCGEHATGITTTPKETHEAFFLSSLACACLEQIKKANTGKPFSMQIHFWGPHQPFFPTKEFADLYDPESICEYPSYSDTLEGQPDVFRMEASRPLSADGKYIAVPSVYPWSVWQKILARCYGHISMIDAAGGMIIDRLRELGLDEDTLIIWTTDHGDAIASHGGHFDKNSHMSEEVMRVPLAMNWKGRIPSGRKDSHLVYTCDIPVTIADAAQLSFSNKVDGASLLSLAEGKANDWRKDLMCESYGHGYGTTIIGRMLLAPPYKLVMTEDDLMQLYDLSADPFEMNNLASDERFSDVLNDMQKRLKIHMEKSSDPVPFQELKRRVRSEKKN